MDYAPFARPLYVMLKPAGAQCNLACDYCYYADKSALYGNPKQPRMSDELLERFTREYIHAQTMPQVLFTWHGGEPLLRTLDFYRKALALQKKYAAGHHIDNCIQTNGTLLNDDWCRFFKENHWLVGISIDGPEKFHNAYRRNTHGSPSFTQVMHGIELLNKHGVEWNAMAVVNRANVGHPEEFYNFFRQIDCRFLQFTPIVERFPCGTKWQITPQSIHPEEWGDFLCALFDEWIKEDVGKRFVQIFDATLANWTGVPPGICSLSEYCGHATVMEYNGDVYACDHFVFPKFLLGNLNTHTLVEMLYGERQQRFGQMKSLNLPTQCRECRYLFACHGECPKNRFTRTPSGEVGLNYLCKGYHKFFTHVAPYMDFMAEELAAGRPPANVMNTLHFHR